MHPTEAYFVAIEGIGSLGKGVYHFCTETNSLDLITADFERGWISSSFDGLNRSPFVIEGIWILTSVFERNRFRYREPRTFRTIFLDAGHLLETFRISSSLFGWHSYPHHGVEYSEIEKKLGLAAHEEAVIQTCAIGRHLRKVEVSV